MIILLIFLKLHTIPHTKDYTNKKIIFLDISGKFL